MNRVLIATAVASVLIATPVLAQSSKFAAMWEKDKVNLARAFDETADDGAVINRGFEDTMAYIKAPQGKELLIGVSGVAMLNTFTEAKGKNGEGPSESEAMAGLWMTVKYMPEDWTGSVCRDGYEAAPGKVPLSMRKQTLSVDVDLDVVDVEGCMEENDVSDLYLDEGQCIADLLDIEGDVTVALGLKTAASHHFNFVAPDLPYSTTYKVAACFTGRAIAEVIEGEGAARASVAIGKRMVTVQEVRAIKDNFVEMQ